MERRSETVGRLLRAAMAAIAAVEGKTQQTVEGELGELIGVAGATMQRYKAGHLPPDDQRIAQLAAAGVSRGLMGRLWLERFLAQARYPFHDAQVLVGRLFPEPPAPESRQARPNLPPPTYAHFIMRRGPYNALLDGLRSELPATLLVSMSGMGKTSLARAVADACLDSGQEPHFATAVWVSDKDHPGTTNLSTTLDTIARVLDYPGLAGLAFAERQHAVAELLRREPVLLVIDNADTITDEALLAWLARLPGPSKALVTSRAALPALAGAFLVELGPMARHETRALIADWLPRSRLRGIPDIQDELAPLAAITGGNPKALELTLGLLQHRSRDAVIEEVRSARAPLFDELFEQGWNLLDGAAQRVLLALPLFPSSAAAEALAYCADLPAAAFARSAERLVGLSLLDIERDNIRTAPRYNAHALVRTFAEARLALAALAEQERLRERWLGWCADTAEAVGFCWDDLDRLDTLDREHAAIQAAIGWATEHRRDELLIGLVEGVRYYYNVRGFWDEEVLRNHERRLAAARRLGDRDNELLALAHLLQVLSKQGRLDQAEPVAAVLTERGRRLYHERMVGLAALESPAQASLRDDVAFEYGHALALYARARSDLAAAAGHWRELLRLSQRLGGQKYVVNRRWLAIALLEGGDVGAARDLFEESLAAAGQINDVRSVVGNTLKLARIALDRGETAAVADALERCRSLAARHSDRRRLAEYHRLAAQLLVAEGDPDGAAVELRAALDLFERLGMGGESQEARAALAGLEPPGADAVGASP